MNRDRYRGLTDRPGERERQRQTDRQTETIVTVLAKMTTMVIIKIMTPSTMMFMTM